MPHIDYLLIGHITADVVGDGRLLGGTVSYAASIAHAFGHRVGLLTSAAAGEVLLEPLTRIANVTVRLAQRTTTFANIYHEGQRTQYVYDVAAPLTYDMLPTGWLDAPLVHLAPLVQEIDTDIARRFPDATVLLTPQGLLRRWDGDGRVHFQRWFDADVLSHVDIVIFSKHDVAAAPELEAEFAQAVEYLVVTDGERGGTYYHNGKPTPYAPFPVEEVEPTGAGDVFAASLFSSLPKLQHNLSAAVRVAAHLAALSVTRQGAHQDFSMDEINAVLDTARGEND